MRFLKVYERDAVERWNSEDNGNSTYVPLNADAKAKVD